MIMDNINKSSFGQFNILYIDSNTEFLGIFSDLINQKLICEQIGSNSLPYLSTWRITTLSGQTIIGKHCIFNDINLSLKEILLGHTFFADMLAKTWAFFSGEHFDFQLLRKMHQAINQGCDFIPKVFLAAEKKSQFGICEESWLLMEFIEGEVLKIGQKPEPESDWLTAIPPLLTKLHGYGLAHGDPSPWNLVKNSRGYQLIDFTLKRPVIFMQAEDVLNSRDRWELDVITNNISLTILCKFLFFKRCYLNFRRSIKFKMLKIFNKITGRPFIPNLPKAINKENSQLISRK
jgi:hypothetical protein